MYVLYSTDEKVFGLDGVSSVRRLGVELAEEIDGPCDAG
jgi:hypothetical protein